MALDAFVYCDCFEKDNLHCNPPGGVRVTVAANGDITCDVTDQALWCSFMAWKQTKACRHPGMILVLHRLGTPPVIDLLRAQFEKEREKFPILLAHVLYSGTHTCDWIPFPHMQSLAKEVQAIDAEEVAPGVSDAVRLFQIKMAELIIAAQCTSKAICF
ncbi:MAG TPA: hypothetical protein VK633_14610 [Verrucomicrobiae bacterium]|nr:hypothetical protein [Verrucomicrobiae bacterium]